jgi:hypothetical protein
LKSSSLISIFSLFDFICSDGFWGLLAPTAFLKKNVLVNDTFIINYVVIFTPPLCFVPLADLAQVFSFENVKDDEGTALSSASTVFLAHVFLNVV